MTFSLRMVTGCCLLILAGCSGTVTKEAKETKETKESVRVETVDPATAGVLSGTIRYTGRKPKLTAVNMDQDPECIRAHGKMPAQEESLVVGSKGGLANVFVYVSRGLEGRTFAPPAEPVTVDQKGCWFHPRVLGIRTGQTLQVTNSDPVTHNIHPMAQLNREWNYSQSPQQGPITRKFARQEVMIPVKCNVHNWMRSYIGVVDHPYFAVTDNDGTFRIGNVPPGEYVISAWQEKMGRQEQTVRLSPSGTASAAFTFTGE